jgi:hypothetical protein
MIHFIFGTKRNLTEWTQFLCLDATRNGKKNKKKTKNKKKHQIFLSPSNSLIYLRGKNTKNKNKKLSKGHVA